MPNDSLQLSLFPPKLPEARNERIITRVADFHGIESGDVIAIDVETRDPQLKEKGPATYRGGGHLAGVSIACARTGSCAYFSCGHLSGNSQPREVLQAYFRDLAKRSDIEIVGANVGYDIEWLVSELGIQYPAASRVSDVQLSEALIDEEQDSYTLESLGVKYFGKGKDESLLRDAASAFGVDAKSDLWKLDAKYVEEYAAGDAKLTLAVHEVQKAELAKQDLGRILTLEESLIETIFKMRRRGVRINEDYAAQLALDMQRQERGVHAEIKRKLGYFLDVWSGPRIAQALAAAGISVPKTAKGNPSITGDWLDAHEGDNELLGLISDARSLNRLCKFVTETILGNCVKGRIHASFKQMKGDDSGTRTGRMACADPNLQQIPSRDPTWAKKIRACFIPEDGCHWAKIDYSQQEPRILVHYASILGFAGADAVRQGYINNKDSDFYNFITEMASITRRQAKDLTLGRCYGMGVDKMAQKLGCTRDDALQILGEFDRAAPFIKQISEYCDNKAQQRGWIKTLGGRRRHFNQWTSRHDFKAPVSSREVASKKYGEHAIRRADTRKALNSLIQGSAADMMKYALVAMDKELGAVIHMTVHDEVGVSSESMEKAVEVKELMERALPMSVPIKADLTYGETWS